MTFLRPMNKKQLFSIQDNKTHGSEEMSNISESELVSLRGLWGKTWVKLNVAIRLKSVASSV